MARYVRDGVAVVFPSGRVLTHSLPIRPEAPERPLSELRDVTFDDPITGTTYVLNYSRYYVVSPATFQRIVVPPPSEPVRFDLPDESEEPRYLYDLLPCPVSLLPFPGLRVCVESHLKSAVFLHPDRARPTPLDQAVRLVSFGTIELPAGGAPDYRWEGRIEREAGGLRHPMAAVAGALLRRPPFRRRFRDASWDHDAGAWRP